MTKKQYLTDLNLSDFGMQDLEFNNPCVSDVQTDFENCDFIVSDVDLSNFGTLPHDFFNFTLNFD